MRTKREVRGNRHIMHIAWAVRAMVTDPHTSRARQLCYEASEEIVRRLGQLGTVAENVWGHVLLPDLLLRHHWVRVGEQVVDVTIDQVGEQYPPVFIGRQPSNYYTDAEWMTDPQRFRSLLMQAYGE